MLSQQLSHLYFQERCELWDLIARLEQALGSGDQEQIRTTLRRVAVLAGPRFSYEEEALFPALETRLDRQYVALLRKGHARTVEVMEVLVELLRFGPLSDAEAREAVTLVHSLLAHVAESAGATVAIEGLPDAAVKAILDAREHALEGRIDIFHQSHRMIRTGQWA